MPAERTKDGSCRVVPAIAGDTIKPNPKPIRLHISTAKLDQAMVLIAANASAQMIAEAESARNQLVPERSAVASAAAAARADSTLTGGATGVCSEFSRLVFIRNLPGGVDFFAVFDFGRGARGRTVRRGPRTVTHDGG